MSKKKKKKQEPQKEKWFKPSKPTGWEKTLSAKTRRAKVLNSYKGDLLASARALQAMSMGSTDKTVKRLARLDAQYFFEKYQKEKK